MNKLADFLSELKRRRVFRVAAVYAGVAFVIVQLADYAFEQFNVSSEFGRFLTIVLALGFLIVVALAWAFDITDKGIVRDKGKAQEPVTTRRPIFSNTVVGIVVVLAIIVAAWSWWSRPSREAEAVVETGLEKRSIAVLPFVNFSDNKDDEYFCDGVTEDIITHLTRINDLKVTSRTTIMKYKGTDMSLRDIGNELGVSTILEGSVRRVGERVRIVCQLNDALTDEHIWAETYDRNISDILAIQSDVADNIAIALEATLSTMEEESIEHKPTENTEAYDYYLRGKELEYGSSSYRDFVDAEELYQKAIELDPTFTEAYAGLLNTLFLMRGIHPEERWTQSEILETVRNTITSTNMEEWTRVENTPRGTTIIIDSRRSFEPGSADLKPELLQFLDDLIFVMEDPHNLFPIAVEGHTDNLPPTGELAEKYPSNWEFSQARAAAVVGYLQSKGVPGDRLRAVGFADGIPSNITWYQARTGITEHMIQMANTTPERRAANMRLEITFLATGSSVQGGTDITHSLKGTTVIVETPFGFDSGSAELNPMSFPFLDNLVPIIKDPGNEFPVSIEGHTDNLPPTGEIAEKYPSNWELSGARAAAVVRYLQSKGVPGSMLQAVGFADRIPHGISWSDRIDLSEETIQAQNATQELRAANNRVEISFLAVR